MEQGCGRYGLGESGNSEFEAALKNGNRSSLKLLCERKSQESESEEEKETWGFMKVMFLVDGTARSKILSHLGFSLPAEESNTINNKVPDESMAYKEGNFGKEGRLLIIFNKRPSPKVDTAMSTPKNTFVTGDCVKECPKDVNGLGAVQRALVVRDYKGAVTQFVAVNRLPDPLVIAPVGVGANTSRSPNDLMGIAKTSPLKSWKETLAIFSTFSQADEWTSLCNTLAARLMAGGDTAAATLCYICAEEIEKAVEMWSNLGSEDLSIALIILRDWIALSTKPADPIEVPPFLGLVDVSLRTHQPRLDEIMASCDATTLELWEAAYPENGDIVRFRELRTKLEHPIGLLDVFLREMIPRETISATLRRLRKTAQFAKFSLAVKLFENFMELEMEATPINRVMSAWTRKDVMKIQAELRVKLLDPSSILEQIKLLSFS